MGQEWAADTPFFYFTDQPGIVGEKIGEWRVDELAGEDPADRKAYSRTPHPQADSTFAASKLNWDETALPRHREILALYRTCLALRSAHAHFRNPERGQWTAAAVAGGLAIRWRQAAGDWLLVVSLEAGNRLGADSPLLRARPGFRWKTEVFSESPEFGGSSAHAEFPEGPIIPSGSAAWLVRES
jgi:maltooligosyltrehalose trehalohydrolase